MAEVDSNVLFEDGSDNDSIGGGGVCLYSTFWIKDLFFGIEVNRVQEVSKRHEMTGIPLASELISGLINLRGQIVTTIDLRKRLGFQKLEDGHEPMNVIVRDKGEIVNLLVDKIGDVLEVDKSVFEQTPSSLSELHRGLISGVYKLDSKLLLILDTHEALNF